MCFVVNDIYVTVHYIAKGRGDRLVKMSASLNPGMVGSSSIQSNDLDSSYGNSTVSFKEATRERDLFYLRKLVSQSSSLYRYTVVGSNPIQVYDRDFLYDTITGLFQIADSKLIDQSCENLFHNRATIIMFELLN